MDNNRKSMRGVRAITALLVLALVVSVVGFLAASTASAAAGTMRLTAGEGLAAGQSVVSPDGRFTLSMQGDGNLVGYGPGHVAYWASNTAGRPGSVVVLQGDGNLVISAPGNVPIWASNTAGHPGAMLDLQSDRNIVVYSASRQALWASNTRESATPPSSGGGCNQTLEMWLLRDPARSTTSMRLRVQQVTTSCTVASRVYLTGSGNGGKSDCASSNWLPQGEWAIGNNRGDDVRGYFANGHGTLAGRATFDLKLLSTPLSCARPRQAAGTFAIHTERDVRVPSSSTSSSYVTAGCVKLTGADMTDFYNHWAALPSIAEGGVHLHVVNTSSLPAASGWVVTSHSAF